MMNKFEAKNGLISLNHAMIQAFTRECVYKPLTVDVLKDCAIITIKGEPDNYAGFVLPFIMSSDFPYSYDNPNLPPSNHAKKVYFSAIDSDSFSVMHFPQRQDGIIEYQGWRFDTKPILHPALSLGVTISYQPGWLKIQSKNYVVAYVQGEKTK